MHAVLINLGDRFVDRFFVVDVDVSPRRDNGRREGGGVRRLVRVAGLFARRPSRVVEWWSIFFAKGSRGLSRSLLRKDVTGGCKILGGSVVICGYKLVDELLLK